ncbi:MAG: hypothetical protein IPL39_03140 [Opitutaceae bacterium]|nr:hypothetical protein [Opitutaceae bacterium]
MDNPADESIVLGHGRVFSSGGKTGRPPAARICLRDGPAFFWASTLQLAWPFYAAIRVQRLMRTILVVIGLVFVLGGIHAVMTPKAWTWVGGNRWIASYEFSKESSLYFGGAAIGLGVVAVIAGFRYRKIVMRHSGLETHQFRPSRRPAETPGKSAPSKPSPLPGGPHS